MTVLLTGEFATGQKRTPIPFKTYRWTRDLNGSGDLEAIVDMNDPDVQALQLRNAATAGKAYIALVEQTDGGGDWFAMYGQLDARYGRNNAELILSSTGMLDFLNNRTVMPPLAGTIDTSQFVIPDPADTSKTKPNPALATSISGVSYGTMIKRLIQQAMSWPGGGLPIIFQADEGGDRVKNWDSTDVKPLGDAITDIVNLENGPDVDFQAQYRPGSQAIDVLLRTGTGAQPQLRSATVHRWDLTVEAGAVDDLQVRYITSGMGSLSWAQGGRGGDTVITQRAYSSMLLDRGYPLMEIVDTSHTTASEAETIRRYASQNLAWGGAPIEVWSFKVRKDLSPYVGTYLPGDRCLVSVKGDPYIPDGSYLREVVQIAGDEGDWVSVSTTEVL